MKPTASLIKLLGEKKMLIKDIPGREFLMELVNSRMEFQLQEEQIQCKS